MFLSEGTPTIEPPVVDISVLNGTEDRPVTVYLSAHIPGGSSSAPNELTVKITSYPSGSTFDRGMYDGQFWILTSADFGELQLSLPEHVSGIFEITAEAMLADSLSGRMGTVVFAVQPIADTPVISIVHHDECIYSGQFSFIVASSLVDVDGSEALTVTVSGLPSGSQLSAGRVTEQGDYILESVKPLTTITATVPSNFAEGIDISLTATSTEQLSSSTASTNVILSLSKCVEGIHYIVE